MFEIFFLLLSAYVTSDPSSVHLEHYKIFTLEANDRTYNVSISVTAGNITEVKYQSLGNLLIHMNPIGNGTLIANIPRALIEPNYIGFAPLYVLENGQKIDYEDYGHSCEYKSVKIKFDQNIHEITI